jgi:hypothetical protein
LRSESAGEIDCIAKVQPYESSNRMVSLDQAYAMMGCTFPPLPRIYTNGIQTCSYMKSLLIIHLQIGFSLLEILPRVRVAVSR